MDDERFKLINRLEVNTRLQRLLREEVRSLGRVAISLALQSRLT